MMAFASRYANWVTRSEKGVRETSPPKQIVQSSLTMRETRFPVLRSIVEVPVFDSNGDLQTTPGYMPSSQIYCSPNIEIPDLDTITADEAKSLIINDLLEGFPFIDEASRTHAIATLLLPFCRALISGPTPLYLC